jgi:8-amino-7-oxononanoate synthase
MTEFDSALEQGLDSIKKDQLLRSLRRVPSAQGPRIEFHRRSCLNFSSNDYLGLANDPKVKDAATRAIERFGAGSGASRLICGSLAIHHELEEELAKFKGTQAALSFSSGYSAALGTICALVGKEDVVILDKLVHASIIDAARLSGAKMRVFRHNDPADLEKILKQESRAGEADTERQPRKVVITESVFSMDGDRAPLRDLVALKNKYGAWLMLDEAHATGLIGPNRRGLAELDGLSDHIEIQMGTLGKALGSAGGFVCGSRALIDYLINKARSFIFSTAPVPAAAGAALAALQFLASNEGKTRCDKLWRNIQILCAQLKINKAGSAIVPIMIGDESLAVKTADELLSRGIFIPAIRYPTVSRGSARLRLTLSAAHSVDDIESAAKALIDVSSIKNR